ncbi:MAG: hypothetical protein R2783_06185 [Gelidibacter sp.]
MKTTKSRWTKKELKVYILLLCAKIDNEELDKEIELIKTKTDTATFNTLYNEFSNDDEDTCFEKIEDAIGHHEYSPSELNELKREIHEVFASDKKILLKERNLERVFDNILY